MEIITPCFSGGAQPDRFAEIRAPAIRGQLRWWFRTLGGFQSLAAQKMSVRQQEDLIFGSASGGEGHAGKLMVRVRDIIGKQAVVDDEEMGAPPASKRGYVLFPLRPERKGQPGERLRDRAVIKKENNAAPFPQFILDLAWRGAASLNDDIAALVAVFGHLGALGFRSRRAMGALAFTDFPYPLAESLKRFGHASSAPPKQQPVAVMELQLPSVTQQARMTLVDPLADIVDPLAEWLRSWRAHGRTGLNDAERASPGFRFAQSDHFADEFHLGPGYRPMLGMPLLTKYGKWNTELPPPGKQTKGRFASPVLLRPHRDASGGWHALVIFVEAHKWPSDPTTGRPRRVFLNGGPRDVSLDLYEEMKKDRRLKAFP